VVLKETPLATLYWLAECRWTGVQVGYNRETYL
jgi:hypothetical protein